MRTLLLALAGLVALAVVPAAAEATSVWLCANNTVCAGAGVEYNYGASYADVCVVPFAGCQFVPQATAPGVPVPARTCPVAEGTPVVLVVCVGG